MTLHLGRIVVVSVLVIFVVVIVEVFSVVVVVVVVGIVVVSSYCLFKFISISTFMISTSSIVEPT